MNRKPFRKYVLRMREKTGRMNMFLRTINNASELVENSYGKYYGAMLHHNIDAYLKSTITFTNEKFKDAFRPMLSCHVRSAEDIQRCVYSYVALAEKRGHLRYVNLKKSFRLQIHNPKLYVKFEKYNPVFFCMNDSEYANDSDRQAASRFLNSLFPEKSQFEK